MYAEAISKYDSDTAEFWKLKKMRVAPLSYLVEETVIMSPHFESFSVQIIFQRHLALIEKKTVQNFRKCLSIAKDACFD